MKKLIFEGAGWEVAENNGVGNCRIRTRIKNSSGRVIYLELGGTPKGKYMNCNGMNFPSHIDHLFYCDIAEDSKSNYSKELSGLTNTRFEYTKGNILDFVNNNLDCSFDDVVVENDGVRVHDTTKALCSCK